MTFKRICAYLFVVTATTSLTAAKSAAQLIFTSGVPNNRAGSTVSSPFTAANNFPLLSTTEMGSFDFYLSRSGGNGPSTISANFTWNLYANAGGTPGASLASASVTDAAGSITSFFCCSPNPPTHDVYLFSGIGFGGLSLAPGTYWLGLSNYSDAEGLFGFWAPSISGAGGEMYSGEDGLSWTSAREEGAFSIYAAQSTVPEPSSIAFVATGLVGLLGAARRRAARFG